LLEKPVSFNREEAKAYARLRRATIRSNARKASKSANHRVWSGGGRMLSLHLPEKASRPDEITGMTGEEGKHRRVRDSRRPVDSRLLAPAGFAIIMSSAREFALKSRCNLPFRRPSHYYELRSSDPREQLQGSDACRSRMAGTRCAAAKAPHLLQAGRRRPFETGEAR
jgi:hypothetical protein